MPRTVDQLGPLPDVRIFVRNASGEYLAGDARMWFFTPERSKAAVFRYREDQVQEQLEVIQATQGIRLDIEPIPLHEIYETCDRCKDLFMPFMTFFDGQRFLCEDCRSRLSRRVTRR